MDTIELEVTGIAHGGVAVGREASGRVVFVADAIPGERVRVRLIEEKKSFARGVATEVLDASPHRVPHVWTEAGIERVPEDRAGGAEFGHIALAHQRALKGRVLVEALERFAKVDAGRLASLVEDQGHPASMPPPLGASAGDVLEPSRLVRAAPGDEERNGLGWRTRVRLHVDADGRPGPYAARSHRVVAVSELPLAAPAIRPVLGDRFGGASSVEVIASGDELRLVIDEQQPTAIRERVGEREFLVDDTGFWQVHREAPGVLAAAVRDAIDPARLDPAADNLDLYGGVGLLGAALAEAGGPGTRLTSVEAAERATAHAAENLAEWVNASAETARVDRWLRAAEREGRDLAGATIVLDPPRSGAGGEVAGALARSGAAQLVYVACDPVALARDTATLEAAGYRLARLRAFDLFPHTHHLEAVATFLPEG